MVIQKRVLFSFFSILIGCLLVVGLCEGILRILGPQWLKQRMREVGVENKTGVEGGSFGSDKDWPIERKNGQAIQFTPLSQFRIRHYEYDVQANIDRWGGRRTLNINEAETDALIPFLGDSFTFGVGVKDKETYVSLLDEKTPYSFINLGMPGSCLADHLDIIEHRHAELSLPKIYVFNVFIGNDLTNLLIHASQAQDDQAATKLMPLRDKKSTRALQSINDFVRNNSILRKVYFIQYVKSKLLVLYNDYRASKGIVRRMDDEIFHVIRDDQHFRDVLELFGDELKRTMMMSESLHFQPIFILIPDRHQVDEKLRSAKYAYYGIDKHEVDIDLANKSIKNKLEQYKIPYIDVIDCLREKVKDQNMNNLYYTLDNHLTSDGHQAVALCAENELSRIISSFSTEK